MTLQPRHALTRAFAAILVCLQLALGGAAAFAHPGERAGPVTVASQQDSQGGTALHDELRCPLCQFASEHAYPLPTYEIAADAISTESSAQPPAPLSVRLQLHSRPASRAPPVSIS